MATGSENGWQVVKLDGREVSSRLMMMLFKNYLFKAYFLKETGEQGTNRERYDSVKLKLPSPGRTSTYEDKWVLAKLSKWFATVCGKQE